MKLRHCFSIATGELKIASHLLIMLGLITVGLFSASIAFLALGMTLPGQIAEEVADSGYDRIFLWTLTMDDAMLLSSQPIEVLETYVSYRFSHENLDVARESSSDPLRGSILLDWMEHTSFVEDLRKDLLDGSISLQESSLVIWISRDIATRYELDVGQSISFMGLDGNVLFDLFVQGIFNSSNSKNDYYISQSAYQTFCDSYADCTIEVLVRPLDLAKTSAIISWARERNLSFSYNKEIAGAVQMFNYSFHVFTMILMLVLSGVFFNFLSVYFLKRKRFYAIQAALGMSESDILKITGCLCELILVPSALISVSIAVVFIQNIAKQATHLFGAVATDRTLLACMVHVILTQGIVVVVLLRFKRKLRRAPLINTIRLAD